MDTSQDKQQPTTMQFFQHVAHQSEVVQDANFNQCPQ